MKLLFKNTDINLTIEKYNSRNATKKYRIPSWYFSKHLYPNSNISYLAEILASYNFTDIDSLKTSGVINYDSFINKLPVDIRKLIEVDIFNELANDTLITFSNYKSIVGTNMNIAFNSGNIELFKELEYPFFLELESRIKNSYDWNTGNTTINVAGLTTGSNNPFLLSDKNRLNYMISHEVQIELSKSIFCLPNFQSSMSLFINTSFNILISNQDIDVILNYQTPITSWNNGSTLTFSNGLAVSKTTNKGNIQFIYINKDFTQFGVYEAVKDVISFKYGVNYQNVVIKKELFETKTNLEDKISKKLNVFQQVSNAGKVLKVNADGNVFPEDFNPLSDSDILLLATLNDMINSTDKSKKYASEKYVDDKQITLDTDTSDYVVINTNKISLSSLAIDGISKGASSLQSVNKNIPSGQSTEIEAVLLTNGEVFLRLSDSFRNFISLLDQKITENANLTSAVNDKVDQAISKSEKIEEESKSRDEVLDKKIAVIIGETLKQPLPLYVDNTENKVFTVNDSPTILGNSQMPNSFNLAVNGKVYKGFQRNELNAVIRVPLFKTTEQERNNRFPIYFDALLLLAMGYSGANTFWSLSPNFINAGTSGLPSFNTTANSTPANFQIFLSANEKNVIQLSTYRNLVEELKLEGNYDDKTFIEQITFNNKKIKIAYTKNGITGTAGVNAVEPHTLYVELVMSNDVGGVFDYAMLLLPNNSVTKFQEQVVDTSAFATKQELADVKTISETAKATADNAKTTADTAKATADNAQLTADAAQLKANEALVKSQTTETALNNYTILDKKYSNNVGKYVEYSKKVETDIYQSINNDANNNLILFAKQSAKSLDTHFDCTSATGYQYKKDGRVIEQKIVGRYTFNNENAIWTEKDFGVNSRNAFVRYSLETSENFTEVWYLKNGSGSFFEKEIKQEQGAVYIDYTFYKRLTDTSGAFLDSFSIWELQDRLKALEKAVRALGDK